MPSASRHHLRLAVLALCAALLAVGAIGCSTTQEKAAEAQAQAEHILKARDKRQQENKRQRKKGEGSHE